MSCRDIDKFAETFFIKDNSDKQTDEQLPESLIGTDWENKKPFFHIEKDLKFWQILPELNLNFHNGFRIEVGWLCFEIYLTFK